MEADDLDNLIADSLGGVQTALEGERKAAPSESASSAPARSGEAVRELKQGPNRSDPEGREEFFCNLIKTFEDETFQKAMADMLQADGANAAVTKPAAAADVPASSSSNTADTEDYLQNFLKSFDSAVGSDQNFEQSMTSLMTSMLSNDLICEPLKQIAEHMEPWLKSQKGLPASERSRYEAQLKLYKQILAVYQGSPDPLPEPAREEVQRLLSELHAHGQPPDEVMQQIAPKEAEGGEENFEDFMKQMGLDSNIGAAEQDLLKKLSEDPEELTKMMKEMAEGLQKDDGEGCKQQ